MLSKIIFKLWDIVVNKGLYAALWLIPKLLFDFAFIIFIYGVLIWLFSKLIFFFYPTFLESIGLSGLGFIFVMLFQEKLNLKDD